MLQTYWRPSWLESRRTLKTRLAGRIIHVAEGRTALLIGTVRDPIAWTTEESECTLRMVVARRTDLRLLDRHSTCDRALGGCGVTVVTGQVEHLARFIARVIGIKRIAECCATRQMTVHHTSLDSITGRSQEVPSADTFTLRTMSVPVEAYRSILAIIDPLGVALQNSAVLPNCLGYLSDRMTLGLGPAYDGTGYGAGKNALLPLGAILAPKITLPHQLRIAHTRITGIRGRAGIRRRGGHVCGR